MAIFSALLSLLSRKLGQLLQAVFGWAITGLFGKLPSSKQTALSAALLLSIAWPLLVLGVPFPGLASWAVAFVPLHDFAPRWILRLVWLALALIVPVIVGSIVSWVSPHERKKGSTNQDFDKIGKLFNVTRNKPNSPVDFTENIDFTVAGSDYSTGYRVEKYEFSKTSVSGRNFGEHDILVAPPPIVHLDRDEERRVTTRVGEPAKADRTGVEASRLASPAQSPSSSMSISIMDGSPGTCGSGSAASRAFFHSPWAR